MSVGSIFQEPLLCRVPNSYNLPPLSGEASSSLSTNERTRCDVPDNNDVPEVEDSDDEVDEEIERAMMKNMQPKPKPRQLPNVVRVKKNVAWQVDHRLPYLGVPRCNSRRPRLASLEQQPADRVPGEQEEARRQQGVAANHRMDSVRCESNDRMAALKSKIEKRSQQRETNRIQRNKMMEMRMARIRERRRIIAEQAARNKSEVRKPFQYQLY